MVSEKVLVIGIDGLPYDVVASLRKDEFPAFGRILDEGCYGVLRSTVPPLSPVAWTSLVTGRNPGKHGVFGFSHVSEGVVTPHYSWVGRCNPVWDVIGDAGKRVVVLNVPFTYPPYEVNGILITGFPSPMGRIESFPPGLVNGLRSKIGDYKLDVPVKNENYEGMDETEFTEEVYRVTDTRAKAAFHLIENYEWDFFMTVFTSLDRIQHVFYGYYDRQSPLYDVSKRKILKEYYKRLDEILNQILSMIEQNTYLIIVSDHGFDYVQKYVGLNNLLAGQNYLKRKTEYLSRNRLKRLWRLSGLIRKVIHALPVEVVKMIQAKIPSVEDYLQSQAYCDYPNTITLRKDLKPEVKMQLSRKIRDYLCSARDSYNNQKIVEEVFAKEDVLSGNLKEAPDLLVLFKRGYEPKRWTREVVQHIQNSSSLDMTVKTGTHSSSYARRGFFSVLGRSTKKNFFSTASILDIAPTILHILGIPIPSDIDGIVLRQIFWENSLIAKREIKSVTRSTKASREQYSYSKEEKESIRKRLEQLGYF